MKKSIKLGHRKLEDASRKHANYAMHKKAIQDALQSCIDKLYDETASIEDENYVCFDVALIEVLRQCVLDAEEKRNECLSMINNDKTYL